ncbi:MAG: PhoH family protein [Halomonadaceae bacterium]|nr:MAG: PhoH family protein [Halomonadaceae bacterium]
MGVRIGYRGHHFRVTGVGEAATAAMEVLKHLYRETEAAKEIAPDLVHLFIRESGYERMAESAAYDGNVQLSIRTPKMQIKPRGENQQRYVHAVRSHDINFGVGPAGTGKTWLAVACAVEALNKDEVKRIMLVRPAVEAGEKLGFLPGDLAQKVDPYLRPLYDALYEMVGFEQVGKLIERSVIEIAPLAFMRGRTLNNSFIILDESQNTTREQMKMFLTRIGFGSTAVITGDITQVDLPRGQNSGLEHSIRVLRDVKGIGMTHFGAADVVRHPLVQRIVEAYDDWDDEN